MMLASVLLTAASPAVATAAAHATILRPVIVREGRPAAASGTITKRGCDTARPASCRLIIYEYQ